MGDSFNIIRHFVNHARKTPYRTAVVVPCGHDSRGRARTIQLTFRQLDELTNQYAHALTRAGLIQKDRVLIMLRPGVDLIAVVIALMKMGAVPVMIDPGMGLRAFAQCVSESSPDAFVGIPESFIFRLFFPRAFKSVKKSVSVGRPLPGKIPSLFELAKGKTEAFPLAQTGKEDEAVIGFTSGGTGIPKGVIFLQRHIAATLSSLTKDMSIKEGDVHLAAFYAFALFMPPLGATTIIPDMDPRNPAKVNPAFLVESIESFGVTNSMGSPVIWERLAKYCLDKDITLPSVRQIFMFGAEVAPGIIEQMSRVIVNGHSYTPYGATEALPIANIIDTEIIEQTGRLTLEGKGVCVGKPIADAKIRIIRITDRPIESWDDNLVLPKNTLGEIVVKGPTVSETYLHRPVQTAEAKIADKDGIWHRMGDIGYIDDKERLWVCGRKIHRVETEDGIITPVQCEAIFNAHPRVKRSALVGIGRRGKQRPAILVETAGRLNPSDKKILLKELYDMGSRKAATRNIRDIIIYDKEFPVDVRHNIKIQRHKLVKWAEKKAGK